MFGDCVHWMSGVTEHHRSTEPGADDMSLEAVLQENTATMRELIAALTAAGAIQTAQAPGVDKVTAAQQAADAAQAKADAANRRANPKGGEHASVDEARAASQEQSRTASAAAAAKKLAEAATKSGEQSTAAPATESADAVELKPWHKKTAALFAELNGKAPELAQVQKAVLGINTHCGREQATALLSRFGAQAISPKPDKKGLDAAQYPEVFALALEVLAGRVDVTESMVAE